MLSINYSPCLLAAKEDSVSCTKWECHRQLGYFTKPCQAIWEIYFQSILISWREGSQSSFIKYSRQVKSQWANGRGKWGAYIHTYLYMYIYSQWTYTPNEYTQTIYTHNEYTATMNTHPQWIHTHNEVSPLRTNSLTCIRTVEICNPWALKYCIREHYTNVLKARDNANFVNIYA